MVPNVRRGLIIAAVALGAFALPALPVAAHPHAWIDLRSSVNFNAKGQVVSLTVEWLFDEFYTEFIVEDIKRVGEPSQTALNTLARDNLKNLRDFDYFTIVRLDGVQQALSTVEKYETAIKGDRLWMRFEIGFAAPVDPHGHDFRYAIFDPTYWIEMLHLKGDVVAVKGTGGVGCTAFIVPANPTPETIASAAALDRTQSGGSSLGEAFAEIVVVECK